VLRRRVKRLKPAPPLTCRGRMALSPEHLKKLEGAADILSGHLNSADVFAIEKTDAVVTLVPNSKMRELSGKLKPFQALNALAVAKRPAEKFRSPLHRVEVSFGEGGREHFDALREMVRKRIMNKKQIDW
jgi:hypothetical protein